MVDIFEFLFCPVHGMFRPDTAVVLYQSVYCCFLSGKTYFDRYVGGLL